LILYPRLEHSSDLENEAARLAHMSIEECRTHRRNSHPAAVYGPTGGDRATSGRLDQIAKSLTQIAERFGYPNEKGRNTAVDSHWAEWLHANLETSPHEASFDSMWHFFSIVLVPDLVRWRWGAAKETVVFDRWITMRHRGRNAFGRLWWRCEILKILGSDTPYKLVHSLGEDELVQIMERPSFAGNRLLSRTTAIVLTSFDNKTPKAIRSDLLRDYQKRMLRLGAFTDFQSLDESATRNLALEVMTRAYQAVTSNRGN
jgi:hypothetical protein